MNRAEFKAMAKATRGNKNTLRRNLIAYFKDTTAGQSAWERRPRVTGEGVADYLTIEDMADALLVEEEADFD